MYILEVDNLKCVEKAPKERDHQHRLQACDAQSMSHKPQGGEIHVPNFIIEIDTVNYKQT
mgnify:CR=1 FL=1